MIVKWFLSKTVREAAAEQKHYRRLLAAQRDVLSSQAVEPVQAKLDELTGAMREGHTGRINIKREELQFAADKWLKPYPNAVWRENVEVLLVALAVAMAIRTFFLQPFKIPTGSMQPTLFGVTSTPDFGTVNFLQRVGADPATVQKAYDQQLQAQKALVIPTGWERVKEAIEGISYVHVVAPCEGKVGKPGIMNKLLIFNLWQTIPIGEQSQTMWLPPDFGESDVWNRAGLGYNTDKIYHQGEDVVKMRVQAGDHLFVDRLTFNFRKPERGEIIVFATAGTKIEKQDEFYIKRLTVLPNERVQIGNDRHMIINGKRLDKTTPHFENVYGFDPATPPRESHFSGHVNGVVAQQFNLYPNLAPLFPDQDTVFTNSGDNLMVFGDNTCNSSDR